MGGNRIMKKRQKIAKRNLTEQAFQSMADVMSMAQLLFYFLACALMFILIVKLVGGNLL